MLIVVLSQRFPETGFLRERSALETASRFDRLPTCQHTGAALISMRGNDMTDDRKLNSGAVNASKWTAGRIAGYAFGLVLVVGLIFAGRWFFTCPCGTMPGAVLWGDVVEEPVNDWSFANEVELCQLQVQGAVFPQALNLNCMATPEGQLY